MKVLVLEDNLAMNRRITEGFEAAGFLVDACIAGDEGLVRVLDATQAYDLAIVDRMLPVVDGVAILRAMRAKGIDTPAIMLTALSSVENRIEGLDAGADDYVSKPFSMEELLARARALLRRPPEMREAGLAFGDLRLDVTTRCLGVDGGEDVVLSKREAGLLAALMEEGGRPLARERILAKVWGVDHPVEAGNVDNYVYFLRRKLAATKSSVRVAAAHGLGYFLEESE